MTQGWEPAQGDYPFAPDNAMVMSPYLVGALDIRWDDPAINPCNSSFEVVGVNVYRSDTSDRGPYFRLNQYPIGGTFYRDITDNIFIENEVVEWGSAWVDRGHTANAARYTFKTKRCPIVKKSGQAIAGNAPADVQLTINGRVVPVHSVFGPTGEVTLINIPTYDIARQLEIPPVLPDATSAVSISYYTNRNLVKTNLDQKLWYRLTTVVTDSSTSSGYNETPLNFSQPISSLAIEQMDYIWREAVRRNNWVLEQGGERAKVFIRKVSGIRCFCDRDERLVEISKQPSNRCTNCYGIGWVGGYEGPYDLIIAPDDAERRIAQTPNGRHLEHTYEVFTGPSPLVTMRDFIVRQTNERYTIGPVRKPSNRGNVMQQHFNIGHIDESDIRYQVPMADPTAMAFPQTRINPPTMTGGAWRTFEPFGPHPVGTAETVPEITEKENIPDEREQRGRSAVWENQNY